MNPKASLDYAINGEYHYVEMSPLDLSAHCHMHRHEIIRWI